MAPLCPQLVKAIIEPGQITCEFQVRHLMKDDAGLWECRVSTTGGQDSRKVKVNIRGEGWWGMVWQCDPPAGLDATHHVSRCQQTGLGGDKTLVGVLPSLTKLERAARWWMSPHSAPCCSWCHSHCPFLHTQCPQRP